MIFILRYMNFEIKTITYLYYWFYPILLAESCVVATKQATFVLSTTRSYRKYASGLCQRHMDIFAVYENHVQMMLLL